MSPPSRIRHSLPVRTTQYIAGAILIPCAMLLFLEAGLRMAGFGHPSSYFITKKLNGRTFHVSNFAFTYRFFPPELARNVNRIVVPDAKAAGVRRVFILGSSAAMGDPDASYGFGRMLSVILRERDPDTRWEVYNTAITAINSHAIVPIARECAGLKPDLFVVYAGNNEVIGPYGPSTVLTPIFASDALIHLHLWIRSLRIGQLAAAVSRMVPHSKDALREWAGMEMFSGRTVRYNDPALPRVYQRYCANLREIRRLGEKAGARTILCTIGANRRDCPPFASLHAAGLGGAALTDWNAAWTRACSLDQAGKTDSALSAFQPACAIDSEHAELQFRMGRCLLQQGDTALAQRHFAAARDLDALRFRADSRINAIADSLGRAGLPATVFVDIAQLLDRQSAGGVSGDEMFYDHVHMNFHGNYLIARILADAIDGPSANRPVPEDTCKTRLAFTDWDDLRVRRIMFDRMQKPLFAQQAYHESSMAREREKLDSCESVIRGIPADRIIGEYRNALSQWPDDVHLHFNLGYFLFCLADPRYTNDAQEQFKAILALYPDDFASWSNLGTLYERQADYAAALRCFSNALRINPWYSAANRGAGKLYAMRMDISRSLKLMRAGHMGNADMAEVFNRCALERMNRGGLKDAARLFQQTLALGPRNAAYRFNAGNAFAAMKKSRPALEQFQKAYALAPDSGFIAKKIITLLLAKKDFGQVAEIAQAASARDPLDADFQYACYITFNQLGKPTEAQYHLKMAQQLKQASAPSP
jgi:tetratricopeptide (TPR) repeat protein